MTPEEWARWLRMAAEHDRDCAGLQACCGMAAGEGSRAIRQLVAAIAEEREACAKIADRADEVKPEDNPISEELARVVHTTGRLIAKAIRARP